MSIVMGSDAIDRPTQGLTGTTHVYLANPSTKAGRITQVKIYLSTVPTTLKVGLMYNVSGTMWCRDSITKAAGELVVGLNTIACDMEVHVGDYVGWWNDSGAVDRTDSGQNYYYKGGEYLDPGDNASGFSYSAGRTFSVQLLGEEDSHLDSLTENLSAAFVPTFTPYTYAYSLVALGSESSVTLTATRPGATILYTYRGVSGKEVASGTPEIVPLVVGENTVYISVQEAGKDAETYTLTIMRAEVLIPTANGDIIELGPTGGYTNWQCAVTQGDSKINYDPTYYIGKRDCYHFSNPVKRSGVINSITVTCYLGVAASIFQRIIFLRIGGVNYESTNNIVGPGWHSWTWTTNPATGQPWTATALDSIQAGAWIYSTGVPSGVWIDAAYVQVNWQYTGTAYRIIDMTIDVVPYSNLKDGHDAIVTLNLVEPGALMNPDAYAVTIKPDIASILKRKKNK